MASEPHNGNKAFLTFSLLLHLDLLLNSHAHFEWACLGTACSVRRHTCLSVELSLSKGLAYNWLLLLFGVEMSPSPRAQDINYWKLFKGFSMGGAAIVGYLIVFDRRYVAMAHDE